MPTEVGPTLQAGLFKAGIFRPARLTLPAHMYTYIVAEVLCEPSEEAP